ncbi:MAG: dihydroorotate dehydrogenase electron transfer subunit [Acidobacteriota bacterium]
MPATEIPTEIVGKEKWGDYHLLWLEAAAVASEAKPGQFVMVRVNPFPYPLLRRPLSIHSVSGTKISLFFFVSGAGTSILGQKKPGEHLEIIGPLGKGFTPGNLPSGSRGLLIGGGRGIAPMYFLAEELLKNGYSLAVFYGGKTCHDLPLEERFRKLEIPLFISTEDGSLGKKGMITDVLEDELPRLSPRLVYACGPEEMLKKTAEIATRLAIPAEFSLESMMGCGFGACWGCVKKIKGSDGKAAWTKICQEGPVFSLPQITWEEE